LVTRQPFPRSNAVDAQSVPSRVNVGGETNGSALTCLVAAIVHRNVSPPRAVSSVLAKTEKHHHESSDLLGDSSGRRPRDCGIGSKPEWYGEFRDRSQRSSCWGKRKLALTCQRPPQRGESEPQWYLQLRCRFEGRPFGYERHPPFKRQQSDQQLEI